MWNVFYPHYRVNSVVELTPEWLRQINVENLLLDVDCTLKCYSNQEPTLEVLDWLNSLKDSGFKMCLLSNGVGGRIKQFANLVELPFIAKACKPLPRGCYRAFKEHNFEPSNTILVGDQIFADIMAGRLANIRTVLVTPILPEQEHWFTRIKRPFEKIILWSYVRKYEATKGR